MSNIKAKLAVAIDNVFDLMSSGVEPREAIVKVSSSLLPSQVERLCQLYNRSVSIDSRVLGKELSTKLGTVESIDPRDIIKTLEKRAELRYQQHTEVPKSAALLKSFSVNAQVPSSASVTPKLAKSPEAQPEVTRSSFEGLHHGLAGEALLAKRNELKSKIAELIHEGEQLLAISESNAAIAVKSLVKLTGAGTGTDLSKLGQVKYYSVEQEPKLADIFEALLEQVADKLPQCKRASLKSLLPPTRVYTWQSGVVGEGSAVAAVKRAQQSVDELRDRLPVIAGKIAALREEQHLIESSVVGNRVERRSAYLGPGTKLDHDLEHIAKVASVITSTIGSLIAGSGAGSKGGGKDLSDSDKFMLRLQHPQHEANLASVRARRSLQELLVDDPIISSAPETDVIKAYNELSSYSPQSVQNPAVLRAVLRQYLQNNASSFDLSQVRQLERQPGAKPKV